jgi:S-(hydroxymethyl)glutathione dehydrogenase / alcohol dehydrogenase
MRSSSWWARSAPSEIDVAPPRAGEVLVRITPPASATPTPSPCPATTRRALFPAVLGHEGGGIVESRSAPA